MATRARRWRQVGAGSAAVIWQWPGALVAAIGLLLLVAAIAFRTIRATSDARDGLLEREVASLVEAQRLATLSELGERLARDALISGDPRVFRAMGRNQAEVMDLLARARARADTPEERAIVDSLEADHMRILAVGGALIDARLRGAPVEALIRRVQAEVYPVRARIDATLELHLRGREQDLARRRRALARQELGALVALTAAVAAGVVLALLLAVSLRRSVGALRRSEQDLRHAVRTRDEFLQVASHELRTPLSSLRLQVEGLRAAVTRGRLEPARLEAKADAAVRQAGRLDALVDGLIDVSRLGEGALRLDLQRVDVGEVVRGVVARFAPAAARDGTELRIAADPAPAVVDRARLEQALGHLLSNALRFGAGRPVDVTLEADDERLRLAVADEGGGVDPDDEERIFGRFERAASWRHYGGLGLGLFLTRRIADAHGGTVRVEAGHRRGSVFVLELPRRLPRGAPTGVVRRGAGADGDGAGLPHH
jgi:signal transduction histidine kinase